MTRETLKAYQRIAASFGAQPFRGDVRSATVDCWVDRIVGLENAKEFGRLAAAIEDANRYAG
jgi:hypothetical protein